MPGNGVSAPRLIREVKPGYTSEAMRTRIQGTVRVQAIVSAGWSISAARVIRSLDERFGLDQEALKAVNQWRFLPGTLAGRAVPVVVEIELTFTLYLITAIAGVTSADSPSHEFLFPFAIDSTTKSLRQSRATASSRRARRAPPCLPAESFRRELQPMAVGAACRAAAC